MIETSQEFINTMRDTQTVSSRISILNSPELINHKYNYSEIEPMLEENEYAVSDGEDKIIRQLNDGIQYETGNYSIFEGNGIALDGTIQVPSKEARNNQYGWYSNYLFSGDSQQIDYDSYIGDKYNSLLNKSYVSLLGIEESENPYVEWKFQCTELDDLNIVFSKKRNEYATYFDIILKTDDDELTISVSRNTNTTYTIAKEKLPHLGNGELQVKVIIYRWSAQNARAKIICMYLGTILEYTDENIVKFNTTKEIDLIDESLPSKQIELVVQDPKGEYNIFEPKGKLANLNSNSRICLEQGCLIDNFMYYVKTDEYIATKPKKEENSLEVSIVGIGRLMNYNNVDFNYNVYEQKNIENILKEEPHLVIDDNIINRDISLRTQFGTIEKTEGIRKLALAVRANAIEDIDNNIIIKDILYNNKNIVAYVSMENMIENPTIEKIDKPKTIEIKRYYNNIGEQGYVANQTLELLTEPTNFSIKYEKEHTAPSYTATLIRKNIEEDITNELTILEDRAIWNNAKSDEEEEVTIKIQAKETELQDTSILYDYDNNGSDCYTIENECIQNTALAKRIFEWIKDKYDREFIYEVELHDTFTYELGDIIELETNIFINNEMLVVKAIITKIEQEYDGALRYKIGLRGAYND